MRDHPWSRGQPTADTAVVFLALPRGADGRSIGKLAAKWNASRKRFMGKVRGERLQRATEGGGRWGRLESTHRGCRALYLALVNTLLTSQVAHSTRLSRGADTTQPGRAGADVQAAA